MAGEEESEQFIRDSILFENCELLTDLLTEHPECALKTDGGGRTPLMLAAHNSKRNALRVLLSVCPDTVNICSPVSGKTALHLACEVGDADSVHLLLQAGTDPSLIDAAGHTPLEVAQIAGYEHVSAVLIQAIQDASLRDERLHNELDAACAAGNMKVAESILGERVSLDNLLNGKGDHGVLYTACSHGQVHVVRRLLEGKLSHAHSLIDAASEDTILHCAISSKEETVIELVLDRFPSLVSRVNKEGANCLHWAAQSGSVASVTKLLEKEYPPECIVEIETTWGTSYMFPFDVNMGDGECRSALHLAVHEGNEAVVKYMLSFELIHSDGVKRCPIAIDPYCSKGRTPLMIAAFSQSLPLITLLLERGADVNLPLGILDETTEFRCAGSGALLEACRADALHVVYVLLENGATDVDNRALRVAIQRKNEKIARVLLCQLAFPDHEYRVNKRNVEVGGMMQFGQSLLPSSLCPSKAVMLNWSGAGLTCLLSDWVSSAALHINTRLRTSRLSLAAITRVDLSNNKLSMFPSLLFQMPSLRVLTLSGNSIASIELPSYNIASTLLESLSMKGNRLTSLCPQLFSVFPQLHTIDLSSNELTALPEQMWTCPSLRELNVSNNQLSSLPSSLRGRQIFVSTSVADLSFPSNVKAFPLERLNIWQEGVSLSQVETDLLTDSSLMSSSSLRTINLSGNKFRMFPTCLACTAPFLHSLIISNNALTTISCVSSLPPGLRLLDVSSNLLTQIFSPNAPMGACHACSAAGGGSRIGGRPSSPTSRNSRSRSKSAVRSQRALSVSRGKELEEMCAHRRHDSLASLKTLNLSRNALSTVVLSHNGRILAPSLSVFDLSSNDLQEVGADVCHLSALSVLTLSENKRLTELPAEIGLLSRLWSLSLKGCSLKEPLHSMVNNDNAKTVEIVGYLRGILEESKLFRRLNVMLLGREAGKSTVFDGMRSEGNTVGNVFSGKTYRIGRVKLKAKKNSGDAITFTVLDCAGQREWWPIHEYLMCRRSMFVVFFRVTEGESAFREVSHWLRTIHSRAPHSVVLILGTHVDQVSSNPGRFPPHFLPQLENKLRQRFMISDWDKHGLPRILDVLFICSKSKNDMKMVISMIVKAAEETRIGKELALCQQVPRSHLIVIKILRSLVDEVRKTGKDPVMDAESLRESITKHMLRDFGREPRDQLELTSALIFARDFGHVIHIEDASLSSVFVLDPLWLCDRVAELLPTRPLSSLVPVASLKGLASLRPHLLSLLSKYQVALLCHSQLLLFPSLLPDEFQLRSDIATWAVKVDPKPFPVRSAVHSPQIPQHALLTRIARSSSAIRRFYMMAYIPSGFWGRMIARIVSDDVLSGILACLVAKPSDAEWVMWLTGVELLIGSSRVLQVKEYCSMADPSEPSLDDVEWRVKGESGRWKSFPVNQFVTLQITIQCPLIRDVDAYRLSWKMLNQVVDLLDMLLDDWFPGLGSRFLHSSEGLLLVNRLAVCEQCFSHTDSSTRDDLMLDRKVESPMCPRSMTSNDIANVTHVVHCFTIEECILSGQSSLELVCASHGRRSLREMAADVLFVDVHPSVMVSTSSVKRGKLLGRGAFGFVFRVHLKMPTDGVPVEAAQKMLIPCDPGTGVRPSAIAEYRAADAKWQRDSVECSSRAYLACRQELSLISRIRHSNALSLLGMCVHPLSIIIELAPLGALSQLLAGYKKSGARLALCSLSETAVQIAKALEYLHSNGIIYRDLKSENVLVWRFPPPFCYSDVLVKLGDYGISRFMQPSGGAKGFGGTEGFMAPEIVKFNGEEEYTPKVDVFSFGMFLYELITLKLPFESEEHVKEQLVEGSRPVLLLHELLYPSSVLDLLVLCWSPSPASRPSSSQLVSFCSAPEFTHILDVVSVDASPSAILPVLDSDEMDGLPEDVEAQIWMSSGETVRVLWCTQYGWLEGRDVDVQMAPQHLSRMGDSVWLSDAEGRVRLLSSSFADTSKVCIPWTGTRLVAAPLLVSPNLLLLVTEINLLLFTLFDDNVNLVDQLTSPFKILSAEVVDQKDKQIWTAHEGGVVSVHFVSSESRFSFSSSLSHGQPEAVRRLCALRDGSLVFSCLEECSRVFCWDATKKEMKKSLDTRKLMPASETIHTLQLELDSHVTCMCVSSCHLFVGTREGVLLVLSLSLQPISVCRPYQANLSHMCIVEGRADDSSETSSINTRLSSTSNDSAWMKMDWLRGSSSAATPSSTLLVTLGQGYRSLVNRFVVSRGVPSEGTAAAIWRVDDWV